MVNELRVLREQLCRDSNEFCRECFNGTRFAANQNPPNVFRGGRNARARIFFIFDKPNDNDRFGHLAPITIFGPSRPDFPNFGYQPTHENLLRLLDMLGLGPASDSPDPLDSSAVHFTNAVKCDKCAMTGQTGRIAISERQARHCTSRFLFRELEMIKPRALVFFGTNSLRYVLGTSGTPWTPFQAKVNGIAYWMMRVPHTSPQSFNTYGRGEKYVEPFRQLMLQASLTQGE